MLDERRVLNVAIAEAPTNPVLSLYSPLMLVSLALMFAAFVAAGAALIADYMDPSFRTPDEVREFLEVPVFAAIPENGFEVPVGTTRKNGH
jgi:capsular polysaccharide biosynthesis protein